MAASEATTIEAYLAELPPERRIVMEEVRALVLEHLPPGYEETMNWGMISYAIPLSRYPQTYNGKPLSYVGLAAQKRHYALYLMGCYADSEQEQQLRAAFAAAGKKIDMGKSCLRFKKLDDLPRDAVGAAIAALSPDEFIAVYEAARSR